MRALTFVALALLAGCMAPDPRFDSDPVFRQASLECRFEAEKATASGRTMADRVSGHISVYQSCMRVKGY